MRKTAIFAVLGLAALALVAMSLAGCPAPEEAAPGVTLEDPVFCPDSLLEVDFAIFSTSIDNDRQPQGIATVFPADTAEIFCTFTLSSDLCCTDVVVIWQYGGETVFYFNQEGTGMPATNTVSLAMPDGGFAPGEYQVTVYIGINEVVNTTFTVV